MKTLLIAATTKFALRTCLIAVATCIFVNTAPAEVIPSCTPPPPNIVAWWPGDGHPNDIHGSNNGTFVGATYSTGEVAQAFSFDGANDFVNVPDAASLHVQTFTIDAWVNPTDLTQDRAILIKAALSTGGNDFAYGLRVLNGGQAEGRITDAAGASASVVSALALSTDVFQHIALTYDGAIMKLYVNGVLDGTTATTLTPLTNVNPVTIGAWQSVSLGVIQHWAGRIDEVEIFDRALTATEVGNIYNAGSAGNCKPCTPPPPDMAAWWPAEGNADNTHNITNSGTLQGGVTFAPGKVGQAFTFDGTGAVNIPNQGTEGELNFQGSDFTVDAWVRFTDTLVAGEYAVIFENYSGLPLYGLYVIGNNRAEFAFRDFNGNIVDVFGTTALNDGLWHHVVGVRADKTGRLYVDGVEENNATNPLVGGVQIICYYARIGGGNSGADNCYEGFADAGFFTGQIDDVALFRRALTAGEVQAIYAAGSSGMCGSTPTPTPTPTATATATPTARPPVRQQRPRRLPRQPQLLQQQPRRLQQLQQRLRRLPRQLQPRLHQHRLQLRRQPTTRRLDLQSTPMGQVSSTRTAVSFR
jgi:hypothetical protein